MTRKRKENPYKKSTQVSAVPPDGIQPEDQGTTENSPASSPKATSHNVAPNYTIQRKKNNSLQQE